MVRDSHESKWNKIKLTTDVKVKQKLYTSCSAKPEDDTLPPRSLPSSYYLLLVIDSVFFSSALMPFSLPPRTLVHKWFASSEEDCRNWKEICSFVTQTSIVQWNHFLHKSQIVRKVGSDHVGSDTIQHHWSRSGFRDLLQGLTVSAWCCRGLVFWSEP